MIPWAPTTTGLAISSLWVGVSVGLDPDLIAAKLGFGISGFIGGLISLGFARYPSAGQRVISVLAGSAAGLFLAPVVAEFFKLTPDAGLGVATVLGLIAMPLFGGAHAFAEAWRKDPFAMIERVLKWRGGNDRK